MTNPDRLTRAAINAAGRRALVIAAVAHLVGKGKPGPARLDHAAVLLAPALDRPREAVREAQADPAKVEAA